MPATSGGAVTAQTAPGVRVNAYTLAGDWLSAANLPNTTANRQILAAWFMGESARVPGSPTDIMVYGNNPLNVTGGGSLGTHQFKGNNLQFATYANTSEAATSWAGLLHARPQYRGIWSGFQASDPQGVLAALAAVPKGWWTSASSVSSIYRSSTGTSAGAGFANNIQPNNLDIPDGTVITDAVIANAMANLQTSGSLDVHIPIIGAFISGVSYDVIKQVLESHKGETWNAKTAAAVQNDLGQAATQAKPNIPNPLDAISAVNQLAADLTTPQKWGYTLALIGGAGLIIIGSLIVIKGAMFPSASKAAPVAAPIIVREQA